VTQISISHHLGNPVLTPGCIVLGYFPELSLHPNPADFQLSLPVHEQAPVWGHQNDLEQRVRGVVEECLRFEIVGGPGWVTGSAEIFYRRRNVPRRRSYTFLQLFNVQRSTTADCALIV